MRARVILHSVLTGLGNPWLDPKALPWRLYLKAYVSLTSGLCGSENLCDTSHEWLVSCAMRVHKVLIRAPRSSPFLWGLVRGVLTPF